MTFIDVSSFPSFGIHDKQISSPLPIPLVLMQFDFLYDKCWELSTIINSKSFIH